MVGSATARAGTGAIGETFSLQSKMATYSLHSLSAN